MIQKIDSNKFSLTILKVTTFSRIRHVRGIKKLKKSHSPEKCVGYGGDSPEKCVYLQRYSPEKCVELGNYSPEKCVFKMNLWKE